MKRNHFINLFVCCVVLLVSCMNVWAQTPDPYLSQPLTFVAKEATTIYMAKTSGNPTVTTIGALYLQYSTNGQDWETFTPAKATPITIEAGNTMMLRRNPEQGINTKGFGYNGKDVYDYRWYFVTTGNYSLEGNIMSLVDGTDFATNTTIPATYECFNSLFISNKALTNIDNLRLPATTLKNRCYRSLFEGCTGLKDISQFQLTEPVSVDTYEYLRMFYGCSGLVSINGFRIPALLGTYACENMFYGCTGLTNIENLVFAADILPSFSCRYMFSGCTNLEVAMPKLEFGTIAQEACSLMFQNCKKLRATPMIEVDSIGSKGCCQMFASCGIDLTGTDSLTAGDIIAHKAIYNQGCQTMFASSSRLKNAPAITAGRVYGTSKDNGGCRYMFEKLAGITQAGEINIGQLDAFGCNYMFTGCTQLVRMPKIHIEELNGTNNMQYMFNGCSSLTIGKDTLFNQQLTNSCYLAMFNGCTSIESISGLHIAADTLAPLACCSLFYNCSNMTTIGDTLKFKVIGDRSCQNMFYGCTHLKHTPVLLMDSIGSLGCNSMFSNCGTATGTDSMTAGDIIVHKAIYNNGCQQMFNGCTLLKKTPNVFAGRVMSNNATKTGGCYLMFNLPKVPRMGKLNIKQVDTYGCELICSACTTLVSVDTIRIDSLGTYGLSNAFSGCTQLAKLPKIFVNKLGGDHNMNAMFTKCSALTFDKDTLFNKRLTNYCYASMFSGCGGLTDIKGLHIAADTLAPYACTSMFYNCGNMTSITDTLKFKVIGNHSCDQMFSTCKELEVSPVIYVDSIGIAGCQKMFLNCYTSATVGLNTAGNIVVNGKISSLGCSEMFSGCLRLAEAPSVFAQEVESTGATATGGCYAMFNNLKITKGNYLKIGTIDAFGCELMYNKCTLMVAMDTIICTDSIGTQGCFKMFDGCTNANFTKAPMIVANKIGTQGLYQMYLSRTNFTSSDSILVNEVYDRGLQQMFSSCTKLASLPYFKADTIGTQGCSYMFTKCTNIALGKDTLPTLKIGPNAYEYLFNGCTSITDVSQFELSATQLSPYCYFHMFEGCTGITDISNLTLKATILAPYCYNNMFGNCSNLTTVWDAIQVSVIGEQSCAQMFNTCKKLDAAPAIIADSIGPKGCQQMFLNCFTSTTVGLSSAGDIVVNGKVASLGLNDMYLGCGRLTTAPNVTIGSVESTGAVATGGCYRMFNSLAALSKAGYLRAGTIGNYGCQEMFQGCANLLSMDSIIVDSIGTQGCFNMIKNNTKFAHTPKLDANIIGQQGCYQMWNCTTAIASADTIRAHKVYEGGLQECFNGCTKLAASPYIKIDSVGQKGCLNMFKGCYTTTPTGILTADSIIIDKMGPYACQSMFEGCKRLTTIKGIKNTKTYDYACNNMFKTCTGLVDISNVTLPAPIMGAHCYDNMFNGCTAMTTIMPSINASFIGEQSCFQMFNGCTKLAAAPAIYVDSIGLKGCQQMFLNCSTSTTVGLSSAGDIVVNGKVASLGLNEMYKGCGRLATAPNVTIGSVESTGAVATGGCYRMFNSLAGLSQAGYLRAGTIGNYGCQEMFQGCANLLSMDSIIVDSIGTQGCFNMIKNNAKFAHTPKLDANIIGQQGCYQMWNCTTAIASADTIRAHKVYEGGLQECFNGCAKLAASPYIKIDSVGQKGCLNMFKGCYATTPTGILTADSIIIGKMGPYACQSMFEGCKRLTTIKGIKNTKTYDYACNNMFKTCTGLVDISNVTLPAPIMGAHCYDNMFNGCTAMTTIMPSINASFIGEQSCFQMFNGCTKLAAAPAIYVDSIGLKGCQQMFLNCSTSTTGLSSAGDIVVNGKVASLGLNEMYKGCGRLATAPNVTVGSIESNGTAKTGGCYQMFYQLGGLTKAGSLRADTIQSFGCYLMFQECAKLESMDSIMVDSIGTQGCWQMFYNDGKFAHTPKLDANIIGQQGCYQMWNCTTAIASADTIRAHKIYDEGCREMFSGCKKLAASPYIKIDKVGKNGCLNMFLNCYTDANNGTLTADSIIFGSVGESGCQTMFSGCKRLQVSPKITADSVGYRGFYQMFTTCYASATVGLRKTDTIRVTRAIGRQGLEEMFTGCQRLDTACAILTPKVGVAGCKNLFKDCFKVATTATKRYSEGFGSTAILLGDSACHQMFNTCSLLDSCADLQFSTIGTRACDKMFYLCNGLDVAPAVSAQKVKDYGCFQMFNYANTSATTKPVGFDHARAITLGEVGNYGCHQMFFQCRNLAAAPNLTFNKVGNHGCYQMFQNAYSVASSVYYGIASTNTFSIREIGSYGCAEMFSGCQRLEETPAITAVSVGAHGCEKMFYNCFVNATIGLKNVGNIIANTVASNGYANMFEGCKRLDSIQNHRIYADYMGDHACLKMFVNCTALTQAPRMDVDEMGPYACQYMYNGCTGLTKMPQLPTMKIGDYCYSHMFDGCTKLTDTTSLPVTAITDGCYEYMFQNCSALTVSPAMAAITVKPYCYQGMFKGCAKLTEVSVLPATKLATYCYQNMFQGCTSLVNAPALPATELVTGCYTQMFNGCSALKYIKVNFTDWQYFGAATDPTYKWVTNVGAAGEFICPEALPKQYDENHIPSKFVVTSAAGYRLIFDANGGSWPDGTTEQVSIAQSAIDDIPHATKKGCMFTRWNTKADGTGEDINLGNLPDDDVTYYAQYDSIGVQLHKWQNNAIFLSITNLPAEAEEAVIQVVGGGSAKSATLDLSLVDVGVYQLGFNKKDVSLHQGGILDVTIYDEDENVLGVVSLPIPFLISDAVNSSDLDATDNADIWVLNGGTLTFDDTRTCHLLCITAGGKAVVPETSVLTTDSLVLRGGELVNGSYLYDYPQLLVNGSVLNHSGQVNYQYLCGLQQNYTLSLPSSVNVADVKNIDGTDAIFGVYRYNGEMRAKGQSGWEEIWDPTRDDMTPPILEAGQGYTIYGVPTEIINDRRRNYCYLNFPMTIDLSAGELPEGDGKLVSVTHYGMTDGHLDAGIAPNNAGWNLIGNPYLSNFAGTDETGFENGVIGQLVKDAEGNYQWSGDARYVVIPSDNGQSYTAEMVSESTLPAFKNFFIQVSTGDAFNFAKAGRQQSAPQRAMQADNEVMLGVRLTGNGVDDRMGILLGDDFSDDYELNADLDKWPNNGLNLSATVGKYNLCIAAITHERVTRPVEMRVITTANDTYRFSLAEEWMKNNGALEHLYLYDREKQIYTDLLKTDYEVSLGIKNHSGRFYLSAEERTTPTQIYEMGENMLHVTATNGHISVSGIDATAHVSVYTMSGICIFNEDIDNVADIHAQCGVYVLRVEIGGKVHTRTIVVP